MNTNSRSNNSKNNLIVGTIAQICVILFQFISRTIFIRLLGAEYLGVNGLYGNILTVLSMADLGIANVMLFSMYEPIAKGDKEAIKGLLKFYKRVYTIIALAVAVLGLSVVPILSKLVNSSLPQNEVTLYYILFLADSVCSYFAVYKTTLIRADQNVRIVSVYDLAFNILRYILQILFLLFTKNYAVFLLIQIFCGLAHNILLSKKAEKMYPFIKEKATLAVSNTAKIIENIKYAFLYRVSNVLIGHVDNILISVLVSTTQVGYYSNYSMIVFNINVFINMLVTSVFSSFGNLFANKENDKLYKLFNGLIFFFHYIGAAISICLFIIFNDFIAIWVGKEFAFPTAIVFVIVLNLYNEVILNPLWLYREIMGLFKEIRFIRLLTAFLNLVFSWFLGKKYGIFGILFATFIAKELTFAWYEALVILKKLNKKLSTYLLLHLKYLICTAICFFACTKLTGFLGNNFMFMVLKAIISISVTSLVFLVYSKNSVEFKTMYEYFKNTLKSKRKHIEGDV